MKRIMIVATLVALAQTVAGFSPRALQTNSVDKVRDRLAAQKEVRARQVKFEDIAALPPGKNYVVDLTQRGVVYEFSPKTGQIDFNRVKVRTARGEVAIASFIETTFPKEKLAGFKLASQAFSLGTQQPKSLQSGRFCTGKLVCIIDRSINFRFCFCVN